MTEQGLAVFEVFAKCQAIGRIGQQPRQGATAGL
jgi:hypothetical protein